MPYQFEHEAAEAATYSLIMDPVVIVAVICSLFEICMDALGPAMNWLKLYLTPDYSVFVVVLRESMYRAVGL